MRIRFLCAVVVLFVASATVAAQPSDYLSAEGTWRWNAAESRYGEPNVAREQVMNITTDDGKRLSFAQHIVNKDGSKIDWSIEGAYDDTMRKGSQWVSMAFKRVAADKIGDHYTMDDGRAGSETFTITAKKIVIEGSYTDKGKTIPYTEVWDRVP